MSGISKSICLICFTVAPLNFVYQEVSQARPRGYLAWVSSSDGQKVYLLMDYMGLEEVLTSWYTNVSGATVVYHVYQ